jgi:hypothetical protein
MIKKEKRRYRPVLAICITEGQVIFISIILPFTPFLLGSIKYALTYVEIL